MQFFLYIIYKINKELKVGKNTITPDGKEKATDL